MKKEEKLTTPTDSTKLKNGQKNPQTGYYWWEELNMWLPNPPVTELDYEKRRQEMSSLGTTSTSNELQTLKSAREKTVQMHQNATLQFAVEDELKRTL